MDDFPFVLDEIDLYVTMACNLNCGFCSVRANEHRQVALPLARILRLIDEARELGMQQLHLTGGEPTLHPELGQIVRHASELGIETRLISNGTLLSRECLIRLQDAGLVNIMISLDGLAQTHDAMRGVAGTWHKALGGVREAVALGFRTRVSSVAFQQNLAEIPDLMQIVAEMGVDIFSIFLGSPLGRGADWQAHVIPPDAWRAFVELLAMRVQAGDFGAKMDVIVEQGFLWQDTQGYDKSIIKGRGTGCSTLLTDFDYLIVRGDGNLYQCVFFLHDGPPLGNIAQQPLLETLLQAQNRAAYARFTQLNGTCHTCRWHDACGSGCRGYAQLYSGDWHQPDPRCALPDSPPRYYPLCPIAKLNLRTGFIGGSSEQALE